MKYAISKWYITDYVIFESLDGNKYCLQLDWDLFKPNIAEPVSCLHPITKNQTEEVNKLLKLQKELDEHNPNSNLKVVSQTEQFVYLAANLPLAKIHCLSLDEFHSLSDEEAMNFLLENDVQKNLPLPTIKKDAYFDFLKFLVRFKHLSTENILALYSHSPKLSAVKTIGEWKQQDVGLQVEYLNHAIPLKVTVKESFFERHNQYYPVSYATQSERTLIQQNKLSLSHMEVQSIMLMLDKQVLLGSPAIIQRRCNPQLLFDILSKLSKTQGITIQLNSSLSDSFYAANTIYLPTAGTSIEHAKQLCREYAAALVRNTLDTSNESLIDLYSDSLAWMLAYQYGLEDDTPHLSYQWWNFKENIDVFKLTTYLHNALCYIDERIAPHLFSAQDEKNAIEQNFFGGIDTGTAASNLSKFANIKGATQ